LTAASNVFSKNPQALGSRERENQNPQPSHVQSSETAFFQPHQQASVGPVAAGENDLTMMIRDYKSENIKFSQKV
jgi:hypothetical protein